MSTKTPGEIASPPDLWRQFRRRTKEHFGQHFLINPDILGDLVDAAGVESGDSVLEIGAGCGTLTRVLLARGARVSTVEVDRDAADFLEETFGAVEEFDLRRGDALDCRPETLVPSNDAGARRSVSNLPYGAATEIFFHLADRLDRFERLVWMYQREVARRMCADPGDDEWGRLGLAVRLYADARVVKSLAPGAFHPPPDVHSAAVRLDPVPETRIPDDEVRQRFLSVIRAAFQARRKILPNALSMGDWTKEQCEEAIERAGLDRRARPGTLTFDEYHRLARALQ